ncbi:MAG: addiction module toxin, HicA family [Actinobacteria bacterium]|nr:addiction module toxin, HicA family [Actinomycetota bacterium]MSW77139.1 addiction module toxin, HicA family [Actinomycetota bacterium]MSX55720.1 addiction module toxin, HicA family [Actinomycetota bacterium]MSX94295.1 addiction module toxin, HicA family [Actinomycetota bacterium]MSZ82993.1 addiction module toxin, HicA family [Actinomycetota bacterium]
MTGRDVLRLVERADCVQLRQRGSHVMIRCPGGCQTVIPVHPRVGHPERHAPID